MRLATLCSIILGLTAYAVSHSLNARYSGAFNSGPRANLGSYSARGRRAEGKKGAFMMNRIGPSSSELYIANADGTNERKLLGNESAFEYHATFSSDGEWIAFTTERNGDGNSDAYRCRSNGSGLEKIAASSSLEAAPVLSPDGTKAAFVSTANGYKANVWVMDLATGEQWNITNSAAVAGDPTLPDGHFRPSWSPDGEWLALSSDRNTQWRGHGNGTGWEHTQELSVYIIRPDGTDFKRIATKEGYCLGSPKWSPDGKRIVYYEVTTENTWGAHRPNEVAGVEAQIVSVDVETGLDRIEHTSGAGMKMFPQYVTNDAIGYLIKGGDQEGLAYASTQSNTTATGYAAVSGDMRSPSWSPDGKSVIYERVGWTARPVEKTLYSWDDDWEYRFTDVFPQLSDQGKLAITEKQLGNSSIVTLNPDGSDYKVVFDVFATGEVDPELTSKGMAGAFQPTWTHDGEWIAFGLGAWFQARAEYGAALYRVTANGSYYEALTDDTINVGFPSYSLDGKSLVFREWGSPGGLRVMDLDDKSIRALTNLTDNLPFFSPDGERIVFTRKVSSSNFDVCTIKPDGTDLQVLTDSLANDAHAVWTADGRIMYSSGMYGFRDEAAIYDNTFQPYGQIIVMNADGSDKQMLTDSLWEDSMPLYIPNEFLN